MARSLLFRSVSAGASTPVAVRPISFFTTTFDEVFVEAVRLSNPNGMAIGWESGLSRAFSSRDFSDSTLSRRSRFDALFNTMDTNKDGVLTLEEVEAAAESKLGLSREKAALLFTELDLDGDGVLSLDEFGEIESTDLTSFGGIMAFIKNQQILPSSSRVPSRPLGRWSLGTDKTDKTEVTGANGFYDHSV
mmetsp:Transcript_67806/g.136450  ORF Transcript_67806/g.136450 Transcript_67806/m.136450 type:complete len:191 (+) Transcript_67806:55-627(+)